MTVKKKPTAAQLKARKLFAARAKAGTLRKNPITKKAAVKKNPAKKKAVAKKIAPNPIRKKAVAKRAPKQVAKNPVKRAAKSFEVQKAKGHAWLCIASFTASKDAVEYAKAYHKAHNVAVRVESK